VSVTLSDVMAAVRAGPRSRDVSLTGVRAAVIAAVGRSVLRVLVAPAGLSAAGGRRRFELSNAAASSARPRPGILEVQLRAATCSSRQWIRLGSALARSPSRTSSAWRLTGSQTSQLSGRESGLSDFALDLTFQRAP
jgi:hypothetical protein